MKNTVCVTGASGFIGSHIVHQLLNKGYHVHAVVEDMTQIHSYEFLKEFPHADTNLMICEANLLREGSFYEPFHDCEGVFHVASPTFFECSDPEKELIQPACKGTINVLRAAERISSVRKVIVTSDMVAFTESSGVEGRGAMITEGLWSDERYLRQHHKWYHLSKYLAERSAWNFMQMAGARSFKLVTILPSLVLGPMLQPQLNFSNRFILRYLNGDRSEISAKPAFITDVRDVAQVHIQVYESPLTQGRYICNGHSTSWGSVCDALRRIAPQAPIPRDVEKPHDEQQLKFFNLSNKKLHEDIEIEFESLDKTLQDTVQSFIDHGIMDSQRLRQHA